jgi:PBP1b-binding outer membrane lipoprotein LpoB
MNIFIRTVLFAFICFSFTGCKLVDLFKDSTSQKQTPVEVKPVDQPQATELPTKKPAKPKTPSTLKDDKKTVEKVCQYTEDKLYSSLDYLTNNMLNSYKPKIPNLTMVNNISITNTVCYPELKNKFASKLVNKLKSSSNYNVIGQSLNNKLLTQAKNSGNAYLIRLAKGQNIDYIVQGNIVGDKNYATLTIKLTDVKSGAIVWQKKQTVK